MCRVFNLHTYTWHLSTIITFLGPKGDHYRPVSLYSQYIVVKVELIISLLENEMSILKYDMTCRKCDVLFSILVQFPTCKAIHQRVLNAKGGKGVQ